MRRHVFEAVGGFDGGMTGWGWEDQEISLRLWLLGYELRLVPEVTVEGVGLLYSLIGAEHPDPPLVELVEVLIDPEGYQRCPLAGYGLGVLQRQ